ncbi:hypothetical protein ABZS66_33360 [Dactylosporangium sp. NPDC005572]|uniref:hypothetical protein n=1 Tax=Dactylosporangium sp. NPDC005572 TaxID=3156889 RepID=UPI0033B35D48
MRKHRRWLASLLLKPRLGELEPLATLGGSDVVAQPILDDTASSQELIDTGHKDQHYP